MNLELPRNLDTLTIHPTLASNHASETPTSSTFLPELSQKWQTFSAATRKQFLAVLPVLPLFLSQFPIFQSQLPTPNLRPPEPYPAEIASNPDTPSKKVKPRPVLRQRQPQTALKEAPQPNNPDVFPEYDWIEGHITTDKNNQPVLQLTQLDNHHTIDLDDFCSIVTDRIPTTTADCFTKIIGNPFGFGLKRRGPGRTTNIPLVTLEDGQLYFEIGSDSIFNLANAFKKGQSIKSQRTYFHPLEKILNDLLKATTDHTTNLPIINPTPLKSTTPEREFDSTRHLLTYDRTDQIITLNLEIDQQSYNIPLTLPQLQAALTSLGLSQENFRIVHVNDEIHGSAMELNIFPQVSTQELTLALVQQILPQNPEAHPAIAQALAESLNPPSSLTLPFNIGVAVIIAYFIIQAIRKPRMLIRSITNLASRALRKR